MKNAGVRPPVMSQSGLWKVFSVAQSCLPLCDHVCLFASPWTAARQAFPSITNFRSLLKLLSVKSVMPSNHLIFCHALLLLPSIFPSMRVSFNESALHIRWPKYWSFSFSINPSNEYSRMISKRWGGVRSIGREDSLEKEWLPTPVILAWRSLAGYSPWGCRVGHEERTNTFTFHLRTQISEIWVLGLP